MEVELRMEKDGITVNEKCRMCSVCVKTCPQRAIRFEQVAKSFDKDKWKGILVYAEQENGTIHPVVYELIGIGVIYAARILGETLSGRVPGVDFAGALMYRMSQEGMRLFLLGAKPGVAELAAENLKKKYPGLIIAGTRDGYFKDDREAIESAIPEIILLFRIFLQKIQFCKTIFIRLDA